MKKHSHQINQKFGGALWPAEYLGHGKVVPLFCCHQHPKVGMCVQIKINIEPRENGFTFTWMWGCIAEIIDEGRQLVVIAKMYGDHAEYIPEFGETEWRCLLRFDPLLEMPYVLISIRELTPVEVESGSSIERLILDHGQHLENPFLELVKEEIGEGGHKDNMRCTFIKGFEHKHSHAHGGSEVEHDYDVITKIDFSLEGGPETLKLTLTHQDGKVIVQSVENGDEPFNIVVYVMQMLDMLNELEDPSLGPEVVLHDPNEVFFKTTAIDSEDDE